MPMPWSATPRSPWPAGDVAEARHLVSVADRLPQIPMPDRDERLARAHLALGDYATAAKLPGLRHSRDVPHSSSYSLCMAALTSRLAGDATQADECLKLAATMQGDSDWPRLAIQFISGRISEEEFRNAPERTTTTPMMRASRQCEVLCIIGMINEAKRDIPAAMAAYKACVATGAVNDNEYLMASLALRRLQPLSP